MTDDVTGVEENAATGQSHEAVAHSVIEASKLLLRKGLVARTWGNLSGRLPDGDHFLITPSGRDYRDLESSDLVEINLEGEWNGSIKPSSEKGIHALIYKERPDAKVIVHTHQPYASAISLGAGPYKVSDELREVIGADLLPIADYGLPGTKKLHKAMFAVAQETGSRAILMRAHGLLAFGETGEEALNVALAVEKFARSVYLERVSIVPEDDRNDGKGSGSGGMLSAERVWTRANLAAPLPDDGVKGLGPEADARAEVAALFNARPDVQCIIGEADPAVLAHSGGLKPYLDDFSQIVGLNAGSVRDTVAAANGFVHGKLLTTLGKAGVPDLGTSNVAFGRYAYCMGKDAEEAEAVQMILHKNALAASFGRTYAAKPLGRLDGALQHAVYALKYSKLKDKS